MPDDQSLFLSDQPTLRDVQSYCLEMARQRGFDQETVSQQFQLLVEEIGEFAKAARKAAHIKTGEHSSEHRVDHEAADILIVFLCLCNTLGIDVEKAFREKEEINKKRVWSH